MSSERSATIHCDNTEMQSRDTARKTHRLKRAHQSSTTLSEARQERDETAKQADDTARQARRPRRAFHVERKGAYKLKCYDTARQTQRPRRDFYALLANYILDCQERVEPDRYNWRVQLSMGGLRNPLLSSRRWCDSIAMIPSDQRNDTARETHPKFLIPKRASNQVGHGIKAVCVL
ncbi:hypothetical protein HUJ05_001985 [Dendroctonus ponderosae]|nr:hypothetical protein HUJ05_001985 [Dendroctonus ponderosae]